MSLASASICAECALRSECPRSASPPVECLEFCSSLAEGSNGVYLDLCSSCERRATCALPRPPGGVWRCAAYA